MNIRKCGMICGMLSGMVGMICGKSMSSSERDVSTKLIWILCEKESSNIRINSSMCNNMNIPRRGVIIYRLQHISLLIRDERTDGRTDGRTEVIL